MRRITENDSSGVKILLSLSQLTYSLVTAEVLRDVGHQLKSKDEAWVIGCTMPWVILII